jgi:integrase
MKAKKTKYTLRKDGRIVMTKTIEGKRVCFYGQTDKEVESKFQIYLTNYKSVTEAQKRKPKVRAFDKVAEDWWAEKEPELAIGSVRVYRARYNEVRDEFKEIPVNEIAPLDIVTYLRKLSAQGFSQKVINNKKSIIKGILDNALIHGEIAMNPCLNLPTVKGKAKVDRPPASDADIKAIEAHKSDSDIGRMIHFILWTGCRRGEAAALQEKDIDREKKTAHICKTLAYSSPTPQIKDCPKTEAGVRDVILPQSVIDNLPRRNNPNSYIFFPKGLPNEREFQVAIDNFRAEAGVKCTLHQLRHSYATMLHSAGVDAKDAQYLLGHSSIVVTQDIYTTIDKNAKDSARKLIEEHVQKNGLLSEVLSEPANSHEP